MAKQVIEFDGTVTETLPGGKFRVTIDGQEREVVAALSGRMRMNRIKIVSGDKVKLEFSPYDLNNGRISFRYSGFRPQNNFQESPPPPAAEPAEEEEGETPSTDDK